MPQHTQLSDRIPNDIAKRQISEKLMKTYEKNLEIILTVEMLHLADAVLDMGFCSLNMLRCSMRVYHTYSEILLC